MKHWYHQMRVNNTMRYINLIVVCLHLILSACAGAPPPEPAVITEPRSLLIQGTAYFKQHEFPEAINSFADALDKYRAIDDQSGIIESCLNLAQAHMAVNNDALANAYADKAAVLIEQNQAEAYMGYIDLIRSTLAIKSADYNRARQYLERPLQDTAQGIQLAAQKNLCTIAFTLDTNEREQCLNRYQQLQLASGDEHHLARILRFRAELNQDISGKQQYLDRALQISRALADKPAIAAALEQSGDVFSENGMAADAEDRYLRALFIRIDLEDTRSAESL
jgi:tetratricopeptide (TPR) repeat protein